MLESSTLFVNSICFYTVQYTVQHQVFALGIHILTEMASFNYCVMYGGFLYSRKHISLYFSICEFVQMLEKKIMESFRLEKIIESHFKHNTDKSITKLCP